MKLTKRLLAIVLAAAMLVGMVAISSSAVQLDEDVPTLTWDDCIIDKDTNPYTVRIGFKVYEVDTTTDEYTLIADSNTSNDVYDVNVKPGSVLRVEIWAQTNFHTIGLQLTPAYTNKWLLPTKMTDYTTFSMKATNASTKVSVDEGMPAVADFDESYGVGDGTFEAPVYTNEAFGVLKGQTNHNAYNGIKGILPASWKGTGTAATNYYSKTAVDQWGDKIADENGNFRYNVYQFGSGNTVGVPQAWLGYAIVLNVYQPVCAFNLTVAEDATGSANLFFPEGSYSNVTSPMTYFQALDYQEVIDSPNVNGNWDESMPQVCYSGLTSYKNTVTYPDGTVADKKWIVENAVLTVGGAEGGEDDTTTEAPVEYADLTALQAAIAAAATADTANCTSASVAEFNAALAAANALNVEGTLATEQDAINAAAARLNAAITGLTKLGTCNYAALDAAIAQAKALDENDYTTTSWYSQAYLPSYLEAAEAVARDMVADEAGENQAIIDDAKDALLAAIAKLELRANLTALKAAIATAATADTANCTAASVAEFDAALAAAQELADFESSIGESRQAEVDAAEARLNAAITGLTKLGACDYAALDAAIAAYEAKAADSYKYANWADYTALYEAAKAVTRDMIADEAGANQKVIDDAAAALNNFALVEKTVDYTAWNAAAAKVPADTSAYTPNSVAAYEAAKAAAEAAKDAAVAAYDQAALDEAAADLEAAIELLAAKADKAALVAAIARATALNADAYTPDSWAAADLATVLAAANTVNADDNATAAAVAEAVAAIEAAEAKLEKKADKAALAEAIAAAKAIDTALYTPDSVAAAALDAAIAAAETVNDDANASAAAVADAIAALEAAADKLVKLADKAALKAAIDTLPEVAEDKAIAATWAAYEAELAEANAVYADANATQDAVDAAEAELLAAIAGVKALGNCDYTALDEAIAAYEAKVADKDLYTNWADYEAAYNAAKAVARDMIADEDGVNQTIINDAAEALTAVVLTYKAADYSAVDAAKDAAAAIDATKYTSASVKAVNDAVAAVVEGLDITKQAEVDAMAKAINDAIAALVDLEACDYTALDEALALVPAEDADAYTALTWEAYADAKAAAEAIARDLLADEAGANQAKIDAAAEALTAAFNALKINQANITAVDYDSEGVYAKAYLEYAFTVNGAPSKIQIISVGGSTRTYDRRSTNVTIVSYNANGEVVDYANEDPAYEVWKISLALSEEEYTVRAKYDYVWDTEAYAFAVKYDEYSAEAESFTASVGEYVDATEVTAAKGEVVTFKVITDTTVTKVQFVLPGGSTSTYTTSKAVNNGDGTLTWTITRTFSQSRDISLKVKTPAGWGTEFVGNVKVTIA